MAHCIKKKPLLDYTQGFLSKKKPCLWNILNNWRLPGLMSGGGGLYSEVQCIIGNGHRGTPLDRITDTCENITFPQLRWQAVTTPIMRYLQFEKSCGIWTGCCCSSNVISVRRWPNENENTSKLNNSYLWNIILTQLCLREFVIMNMLVCIIVGRVQ